MREQTDSLFILYKKNVDEIECENNSNIQQFSGSPRNRQWFLLVLLVPIWSFHAFSAQIV